jgi:endonuclease YncB( thermonuclease family)
MPHLIVLFFLTLCAANQAATITGKVVTVADGDTITVMDAGKVQHKIRLSGIDAPEKAQSFGKQSKQNLSDLLFDKDVTVYTRKTDRYGRDVGKVLVDGLDANLEQVRRGLAWHYKAYLKDQSPDDRLSYAVAEKEALAARQGLWQDAVPVSPWEWRHQTKAAR